MSRLSGKRCGAAATLLISAIVLSGCAGAPEPEPEVLSASEAGTAYLDAVCPVNAAWDQADAELERLRVAVTLGDRDVAPLAAALAEVATQSSAGAKRLDPERAVWPSSAATEVEAVRATLVSDQAQAREFAKLDAAAALEYTWEGAAESAEAAAAARAALELPDDPELACAERAKQVEAEREATPPEESADPSEKASKHRD